MANMFSNKTEKQIPKNLSECVCPDATVTNLHIWSERLEKLGKILFWILIVYGITTAIIMSITVEEVIYGTHYQWTDTKTSFDFELFFTSIAETGLYAFLEYCAYHVLALLVSSLALITQNTIVSANVALYEASKNDTGSTSSQTTAPKAPISSDKKNSYRQTINRTSAPVGEWVCGNCGTNNSLNYGQCKKCGQYRS